MRACAILIAGLVLGSGMALKPEVAKAAPHDGSWSVLVITDAGACDRGYRYGVRIANGSVAYQGQAGINLSGTVATNGAVQVSIRKGSQSADGTGRLSADSGAGTWRGRSSAGECHGRWEAERN